MANKDYSVSATTANFAPLAELAEAVDYLDHTILLGAANFQSTNLLKIGMAALCDDEFMQVTGLGPGSVVVKRGTADTVPAQHAKSSLIWFISTTTVGTDGKEHSASTVTGVKYSPYTTGGGALPLAATSPDQVSYNWRFFRPYPPGQMRVRDQRWYVPQVLSSDDPNMRLTWAHRDRLLEADQLLDHDVTNVGPEPGTTYTVRIYNAAGVLKRTEVGIMAKTRDSRGNLIWPEWTYTWWQAMLDLGFSEPSEAGQIVSGHLTLFSTRQGFDSWQGYTIQFDVNTQGHFIKVAQQGAMVAQPTEPDDGTPPLHAMLVGQHALMAAQAPSAEDEGGVVAADGMYVTQVAEGAGQETSFYTPLNRNLFEAPFAHLLNVGIDSADTHLVTMVARPSDRLTDSHSIWTRYDWPAGTGELHNYDDAIPAAAFTPWITLDANVAQLDTTISVRTSSFFDGVSLTDVTPGQVAQIDAEIVRVESVGESTITIARGCYDTVPAPHGVNARMWFFGAHAGTDPTAYLLKLSDNMLGAAVQVKMVPAVYGPPLNLLDVPTDRVNMLRRVERPYAPGQVMIGGRHWYLGAATSLDTSLSITWVHRNRIAQGSSAVDHLMGGVQPEDGQQYRLSITIMVYPHEGDPYPVKIREVIIDGNSFEYTWEMAKADGYRAGRLLAVCGDVTVGLFLETIRLGLNSWQGYVIPIRLPSYVCPPGQASGGGQLPPSTGSGNGSVGTSTTGGSTPGSDNHGDGPKDPIDNGGGAVDGSGPPAPPLPPPDWPDPIEPPPAPDPGDPSPDLKAHWDLNWDRHWDAYNKDNPGD